MSNCIWYKIWHQYLDGKITAHELDLATRSNQQAINYDRPEHIAGIVKGVMEGVNG